MKKVALIVLALLLCFALAEEANPIVVELQGSDYTLQVSCSSVEIGEDGLEVVVQLLSDAPSNFNPPRLYAIATGGGKKYEAETYNAMYGGSSSGGMVLKGLSYNIAYDLDTLPDEVYINAGSTAGYKLIWANPEV